MNCLIFDRGDGVIGFGLKIEFGGMDQFCIVWPDRPPERMTENYLQCNGVTIIAEGVIAFDAASLGEIDPPVMSEEEEAELAKQLEESEIEAPQIVPEVPTIVPQAPQVVAEQPTEVAEQPTEVAPPNPMEAV